ncbi:MAG: HAMP domain-containing protein [Proteobacteria bacterium]|nr:HAMP domain-containing protein [Pseudomonadota bacterium]MBU1417542.1 HAMP domain-containing protein [Pseudomonadota bacterium]MBU1453111.1 HAMP domain-containing protein [Pseudomonadota bacterium]
MSLSRKVSIFVILAFLMSGLLSFGIQQIFIMPSFITLEKETATQNAERVMGAIDRELGQITDFVTDWSHWTDSYNYVKGQQQEYQAVNLDLDNTLIAMKMNFLGYYDTAGKTLWSRAEDLEGEPVDLGQLTGAGIPANHPLMQHKELMSDIKGIIPTLHGPLLVVAGPILTSNEEGPIAGTLMMGRFLDDTAIEQIADLTKLSIVVSTASQQKKPVSQIERGNNNEGLVYTELEMVETSDNWQMHTTIKDIFNNPILALQVDTPRDISAQGEKAVKQSLWVLAATGMLVMLVLWKLLQQAILQPIAKLTEHALIIGKNDNLTTRLNLHRKDEVGILANTFDQMVDRLAETRRHLVDQSYHSGIAEMAGGVLHNIGNALTPLNVRLTMLQQDLRTAPLAEMEQAAAELADPSTPPERRADLQQFVKLAGNELANLIKNCQEKVEASMQQVGQVQEILVDQQRFSRSARVIEPVDIVAIIKDVEAGLSPELKDAMQIEVAPGVADIATVSGSRAALHQIVANIFINAAESIQSAGTVPGRVTVTAEREELQGQSMVGFRFADNGAGIDPDHLGRLFERGFSTKNKEGTGYGLHWSANTLQALGGRMTIESAGTGSGACIFVLLPAAEDHTQQISDTLKDHDGLRN